MAEQEIYHKEGGHSAYQQEDRKGRESEQPRTDAGQDIHNFTIPPGKAYSRCVLFIDTRDNKSPTTKGSTATLAEAPSHGATGDLSIKVNWQTSPGGRILYFLSVYASEEAVGVHMPKEQPQFPKKTK